jgi:hypothetical protein
MLVQLKMAIDVETNLISRVQRDKTWSHGCHEGCLAIIQPLYWTGLSTMTYSRCHWACYLRSRYRIKSMTIRVVTVHKVTRAQPERGPKEDPQLQGRKRASVNKVGRETRGFNIQPREASWWNVASRSALATDASMRRNRLGTAVS